MKKYDIKRIVQEVLLEALDEYAINAEPIRQKTSKIALFPGAPFGGNLTNVINNEARHALTQWGKLIKACQQKYGSEIGKWPQEIVQVAQKLGSKVEQLAQPDNRQPVRESEASDDAARLGLRYLGFGRYADDSGKVVAKTVDGKLVKVDGATPKTKNPEGPPPVDMIKQAVAKSKEKAMAQGAVAEPAQTKTPEELDAALSTLLDGLVIPDESYDVTDPTLQKQLTKVFQTAGEWTPQVQDTGSTNIVPGWNKTRKDIPYDANGEQTVQKLLQMIGDPMRLLRWLIKTFKKETPNGKQRIMQYIGILKGMGVLQQAQQGEDGQKLDLPPGV